MLSVEELDELELGLLVVSLEPLVEPAPAAPLVEDEPDGVEEEAPPPACSFFVVSVELDDEEAAPEGEVLGAVVEPEGARVLSVRLQPASTAAPNARDTARANVETFMWPPWLGYEESVSKDRAANVTPPPGTDYGRLLFRCGAVSALRGSVTGAEPPVPACGTDDELSVFGDGGVVGLLRSQPAASPSETARARVQSFMEISGGSGMGQVPQRRDPRRVYHRGR